MNVRYIFNTSGEYSGFIDNDNLFNINSGWLGFIRNGNEVYNTKGYHIGYLLDDDRIIKDRFETSLKKVAIPMRPLRPLRPLKPLRRLKMPELPSRYIDIFEIISNTAKEIEPFIQPKDFSFLIGAKIVSPDGTFLGEITFNSYDSNSISNKYGNYGSPYSQTSIFNEYGKYGSPYGQNSPFNEYSNIPPKIMKNNQFLGYLSVNEYLPNIINTMDFINWFNKHN